MYVLTRRQLCDIFVVSEFRRRGAERSTAGSVQLSFDRASRRVTWRRRRHRVRLFAKTFSYEASPGNAFRERNMAKEYAAVQPATKPPATAQ